MAFCSRFSLDVSTAIDPRKKGINFYVIAGAFKQNDCSLHKVKDGVSEVFFFFSFPPLPVRLPIYHWGDWYRREWKMEQGQLRLRWAERSPQQRGSSGSWFCQKCSSLNVFSTERADWAVKGGPILPFSCSTCCWRLSMLWLLWSLALRFSFFYFCSIRNDRLRVLIRAVNFLSCNTVTHFVDITELLRFEPKGISSGL